MDHIEQSEGTEDALKVDVEYKFNDDTWFDSVKAGVRWSERDQTTRFSSYNWGVVSEIWGEGGPVWMTDKIDGIPDPNAPGTTGTDSLGKIEIFTFDNFLRGKVAAADRVGTAQLLCAEHRQGLRRVLGLRPEHRRRVARASGGRLSAELGADGPALRRRRRHAVPSG
jgi:hypothetical protein